MTTSFWQSTGFGDQARTGAMLLSISINCSRKGPMRTTSHALQFLLLIGTLLISFPGVPAQDPDLVRHFDYDQRAPLGLKQIGIQHREHANVYDITYESPKGGVVPAYLVVPKGRGPFAAVIWGHWYWGNSSMRNRRQFLDEAVALETALDGCGREHSRPLPAARPELVDL